MSGSDDVALALGQIREAGLPPNIVQMIELASRVGALAALLGPEDRETYLHGAARNMRANLAQVAGQIQEAARGPKLIVPHG